MFKKCTDWYYKYLTLSEKVREGTATPVEQAEFYLMQGSWMKVKPAEEE